MICQFKMRIKRNSILWLLRFWFGGYYLTDINGSDSVKNFIFVLPPQALQA